MFLKPWILCNLMAKAEKEKSTEIISSESSEPPNFDIESEKAGKAKSSNTMVYLLAAVCIALIIFVAVDKLGVGGGNISSSEMKTRAEGFINTQLIPEGGVSVDDLKKESGVYVATVTYQGQSIPLYFTTDGKFISPGKPLYDLAKAKDSNETNTTPATPKNVTKSNKPIAELFIMTYCPYGTQAEKGIIPAIEALKGKADVKIRFVHYFMHGDKEEQETYTQVCIREEQSTKFIPYLKCFLNASDSPRCLTTTGVDKTKLTSCIANKAKTYYAVDSGLSNKYGVQGSPTLVINGGQADFYLRSPSSALSTICSAFNTAPSECAASLSTENPSPGFGYTATAASGSSASCG